MNHQSRNALGVAAVAALTMSATLAVIVTGPVGANDKEEPVKVEEIATVTPEIATPTLKDDGCTIKLSLDKQTYGDGDKPVVTLTVTNQSDKRAEREVTVAMTRSDFNPMSRMVRLPDVSWSHTVTVSVEPGETESVELKTETAVDASTDVNFRMSHGDGLVATPVGISQRAMNSQKESAASN